MKSIHSVEASNKPHLQAQRPTTHHSYLGTELLYKKLQESLARTGNINHPETKEVEKSFIKTLNIDQMRAYQELKSEMYNDAMWPWPVWVRSFISASRAGKDPLGKHFRGDNRNPSTADVGPNLSSSSRTKFNFIYDGNKSQYKRFNISADPTIKYDSEGKIVAQKTPEPSYKILNNYASNDSKNGHLEFSYEAKDPLTPAIGTPSLDVWASFDMKETGDNLSINASFMGDNFPSTEAFIQDQSGTRLFLGASKEKGNILTLYGEADVNIFQVNMNVKFDKKGNFMGVRQGDQLIPVSLWNKQIQEKFKKQ